MTGYWTKTGETSWLPRLLREKGREGTLGSTAISVEAVQPSLGRLGLGEGDGGIGAEENVRVDECSGMNGMATTRGRVPSLEEDERHSDGGGAGVAGRGSGSRGSEPLTGLERPVLFQLQVREVLCPLSAEEPKSDGGRDSVVLFVAVRQREEELVDERGESGMECSKSGGPRGSRGAKRELAGLISTGV